MTKRGRGGIVLLLLLLMSQIVLVAQDAPPPDGDYGGLDIVFLVDQSGSMGGASYGFEGEGTDPLDLRFEAVDYAIDALGQYRLNLAPDVPMQIAVINFGDEASLSDISRGWTQIAPSGDSAEWDAVYNALSDEFSPGRFRDRSDSDADNLGNTNFLDAFQAADLMFTQLPDDSDDPHLRAVILLTDGSPCVPASFDCSDLSGQSAHMNALQTLVSNEFPDDRYVTYVIALDAQNDYWPRWASEWQTITGSPDRAARAETNQQVGVRFYNIMIDLVNRVRGTNIVDSRTLTPGTNTISLPPYLSEARFSVFKSDTSPGVLEITRPDGRVLSVDDAQLTITGQDRPIEVWTILNPSPGAWDITVGSTGDRIDVYLELIPVDVRVNLTGGPYIQATDVELTFELTDATGSPLLILNEPYTLDVTMTIIRPDGTFVTELLTRDIDSQFTGMFQAGQSGTHTVELSAETRTPGGETYTVLTEREVATFEVLGTTLAVANMPSGDYLVGEVIPLAVTLTDERGTPLDLDSVDVVAEVVVDGNLTTYPMTYDAATNTYTFNLPADTEGNYALTVRAVTERDGEAITLASSAEARFVTLASQVVTLQSITPASASQLTHEGYLPPQRQDLVIDVETVIADDGTRVALESLLQDASSPWTYTVLRNGDPYTETDVTFAAVDETPGRYQLTIAQPPAGEYSVVIEADGDLEGTYLLQPDARVNLTVTVQRNWLPEILIGVGILLGVLTVGAGVRLAQRRARLSKHPARGQLELREQETQYPVWTYNLDKKKRNHIEINDRQLRKCGIKSIIIDCPDDRHSRDRKVRVSIEMTSGKRLMGRSLSPGKRLNLSGSSLRGGTGDTDKRYELVKDPNQMALR